VSEPLQMCKALCAVGGHGNTTERIANRSRNQLVILLTFERPPY